MEHSNITLESLEKKINEELQSFKNELEDADNIKVIDVLRTKYLGRKSYISKIQKSIGALSAELKPVVGKNSNIVKKEIESLLAEKEKELKAAEYEIQMRREVIDLSLPGRQMTGGSINIISQVVEDIELQGDLQVRLVWPGYLENAPEDLAGFRVYSAPKAEEGKEQLPFTLIYDVPDPKVEFFIHANDYANEIINFREDGVTKLYKVTAYDAVGVESDAPILEGTSPNLPPSPPPQVNGRFSFGPNSYEVRIEWNRNPEPDLRGYVVYALLPDGTREFKKIIHDINETVAVISDRYVLVEGATVAKQYYVTALDSTPRTDGKRDESEPSDIVSEQ